MLDTKTKALCIFYPTKLNPSQSQASDLLLIMWLRNGKVTSEQHVGENRTVAATWSFRLRFRDFPTRQGSKSFFFPKFSKKETQNYKQKRQWLWVYVLPSYAGVKKVSPCQANFEQSWLKSEGRRMGKVQYNSWYVIQVHDTWRQKQTELRARIVHQSWSTIGSPQVRSHSSLFWNDNDATGCG